MLALVCALLLALPAVALAFGPSSTPIIPGIDVSEFQGRIDFRSVYDDDIRMVYIRSSLGYSYVDPNFRRNGDSANAAGLEIGYYHFCTAATEADAVRQAQFFVDTVENAPRDCRLVLELDPDRNLDREAFSNVALAFLGEIMRLTGEAGAIYASADTARDKYDARLAVYPLWVADYFVEEPEPNDVWRTWSGFQYSDRGSVSGIEGRVDLDHFTKEMRVDPDVTPAPTPTPDPDPTPTPDPTPDPGDVPSFFAYVVQRGDTLTAVARRLDTTVEALEALNDLPDTDRIFPGQVLWYLRASETA